MTAVIAAEVAARRLFVLVPFAMIASLIGYALLPSKPQAWVLARGDRDRVADAVAALGKLTLIGLPSMLGHPVYGTFEERVDEIVSATDSNRRIIVSGLQPIEGSRRVPVVRAHLVVLPQSPLAPGDMIRAKVRLAPVPRLILPGGFDG
ncbi:MAG: DUF4131 domain-containing protein [Candidatus Devosia symbiotica]|nr:DUF4131 domain-containing protein [Candidatus Devosia symbiotica]